MYGSLSTINHGNILAGPTRSVLFVLRRQIKKKKKEKRCVFLSAPLWTQFCIRCNLCYISFLFFKWYKHVYGCKKKKKRLYGGIIHLLIKKAKLQPNQNVSCVIFAWRSLKCSISTQTQWIFIIFNTSVSFLE